MSKNIIKVIEKGSTDIYNLFAMFPYQTNKTLRYIAKHPQYITHIRKMAKAILKYRKEERLCPRPQK